VGPEAGRAEELSLILRSNSEHNAVMSDENQGPSRPLVGIVSLGFLAGAVVMWWWDPSGQWAEGAFGTMIRVGVVIGCLWLALPGRFGSRAGTKISPGLFVIVIASVAVICWRPRLVLLVIPLLGVISFVAVVLKPRTTQR
jgi:hypothetical protein